MENDPRYADATSRGERQAELVEIIETWMTDFPDNESVLDVLEKHRVPASPVMDPVEAIQHPYFRERGMVREITDPVMGDLTIPGFPLRFTEQPERLDLVAPTLGQHNKEVLSRMLGYTPERIRDLEHAGVLISRDR